LREKEEYILSMKGGFEEEKTFWDFKRNIL
jgi:hypothetical protein